MIILRRLDGRTELERFLKALIKKDRLHRWQSLQQLNLWIFDIFDSSYLEPLADFIISRLRDIQGLKLVFNRDETFMWKSKVKGNELQAFIEKITKYMTHLTKFELTVRFLNGEDHHVKAIIRQILRNLPHLEVLTLCFKKCYSLTQKCIEAFKYQAQRHLPKLKTLKLSFGDKSSVKSKLKFDLFFPSLQSLNLCLCNFKHIKDEELTAFISNLITKLPLLQDLALDLQGLLRITDKGIQDLSSEIQKISALKSFEIDLSNCNEVTSEGLKSFAQEICRKNLKLKDFAISCNCVDIEPNSGIFSFANELAEFKKNLEKVHINFSRSDQKRIDFVSDHWELECEEDFSLKETCENLSKIVHSFGNWSSSIITNCISYYIKEEDQRFFESGDSSSLIGDRDVERIKTMLKVDCYKVILHVKWSASREN